jgi:hypothetical protein
MCALIDETEEFLCIKNLQTSPIINNLLMPQEFAFCLDCLLMFDKATAVGQKLSRKGMLDYRESEFERL